MATRLNNPDYQHANSIYDFTVYNVKQEPVKLDVYNGHVCIVVNTASKSPFTQLHYKQFNELIEKFGESKGLRILAFPCNQFGQEELETNEEIAAHAEKNNVAFDMFAKVDVNGDNACPVWKFMKHKLAVGTSKLGDMVKWSYTKFVISKSGIPVERFGPEIEPYKFEEQNLLGPYW